MSAMSKLIGVAPVTCGGSGHLVACWGFAGEHGVEYGQKQKQLCNAFTINRHAPSVVAVIGVKMT